MPKRVEILGTRYEPNLISHEVPEENEGLFSLLQALHGLHGLHGSILFCQLAEVLLHQYFSIA